MRASYNNGDENRPKQEQPHSVETQGRKETKVYKEFKKFFWQSQRFAPGGYYTLNIISKHWLQAWRNKIKKNGPDPLPPINNDLLHPNPYGLRPKIFAQDEKYVLVNNLDVDYEYELCSDEAWAFFAGRYSHFQLPKTFYLNEQYNFVETVRLLSLNIALIDELQQLVIQTINVFSKLF